MLANNTVSFGGEQFNIYKCTIREANDLANNTVSFGSTPAFDLSDATNYPTSSLSGTITNAQLAGSIANSKLANSGKLNDSTNVFYSEATVTASGGKFYVDGTQQQELHLQKGMTYRFNQSDSSNNSHPFYFSTTSDGTHNSGSKYTTGVTEVGTPGSSGSYTQIIVQQDTPTLYYYCGNHSGMGGKAVIDIQEKLTTGSVTNDMLAGSIANDKLSNNTISFGGISLALGGTDATPAFNLSDATNYPTSSLTGTITNAQLAGSIANDKLTNNTVSFGGVSLALGGSDATPAFDLSDATNYPTSSLSGTITNTQLAGSIANSKLANSGKLNDSTNVFYSEATVTVNGGKFYVDGTQQQELHLQKGMTYRFNQSDSSNNSHPFYFSTTSDGTHNSGSKYTTGVTEVGTPGSSGSYTQIIVQQDTPTLYYYCGNHSAMGGKAVIDIQEKLTTGSVTNDMLAGTIPIAKGGTGATSASAARTALGVDAAGTDNSIDVTLASVSNNYLSLSGQTNNSRYCTVESWRNWGDYSISSKNSFGSY